MQLLTYFLQFLEGTWRDHILSREFCQHRFARVNRNGVDRLRKSGYGFDGIVAFLDVFDDFFDDSHEDLQDFIVEIAVLPLGDSDFPHGLPTPH